MLSTLSSHFHKHLYSIERPITSNTMTVEISPCVVGDVEEMAEVASDAFGVSPITIARWRGFSRSFKLERGKKRFGDMFRREPNPSKLEFQVVKATDSTTGEMMGLASWIHFRHGYDKENDPMAELPDESTPGDKKLLTDFALLTEEIRSEHPLRKEPHWRELTYSFLSYQASYYLLEFTYIII